MSTTDNAFSATIDPINTPKPALKQRWWHILDNWKVGIIPLPLFLLAGGLIALDCLGGKLPSDIVVMVATLAFFGFACGEFGKRLPVLGKLGAAAICATFYPFCAGALRPAAGGGGGVDHQILQVDQHSLSLYLLHNRRQHYEHEPNHPDSGLFCGFSSRCCAAKSSAWWSAWASVPRWDWSRFRCSSLSSCRSWPVASARGYPTVDWLRRADAYGSGRGAWRVLPMVMLGA